MLDQGQGGAQAFEDAATLGALFTLETEPEKIEHKLRIYNDIRYRQAVTILFMSRVGDEQRERVMNELHRFIPEAEMPENMWLFAWDSYPAKAAEKALPSIAIHRGVLVDPKSRYIIQPNQPFISSRTSVGAEIRLAYYIVLIIARNALLYLCCVLRH